VFENVRTRLQRQARLPHAAWSVNRDEAMLVEQRF
jgi:hypothetical protein